MVESERSAKQDHPIDANKYIEWHSAADVFGYLDEYRASRNPKYNQSDKQISAPLILLPLLAVVDARGLRLSG